MRLEDSPPLPHNFSYGLSLVRLPMQIQFPDPSPSEFWRSYASLSIHGQNNLRFEFDWTFCGFGSIRNLILIDRSSKTWLLSISIISIYCTPENSPKRKKRNIQANTTSVAPPFIIFLFASLKLKFTPLFFSFQFDISPLSIFFVEKAAMKSDHASHLPPPFRLPSRVSLGRGVPEAFSRPDPVFKRQNSFISLPYFDKKPYFIALVYLFRFA